MFRNQRFSLHRDESGQTALETAIILIAFVVVASVFAFTILSAGNASTEKGQQAIYAGLQGVTSSMEVKGAVIATGVSDLSKVDSVIFTVALVSGGDPIDLSPKTGATPANKVVINYRDSAVKTTNVGWTLKWLVQSTATPDPTQTMLRAGELAEITVPITATLGPNTAFTLEVKPPTGSVVQINRTTPAAILATMELH